LQERGGISGLTVTMLGDLKYGRTVHSLAKLLTLFDVKVNYVSPDILRMPADLVSELNGQGLKQTEHTDLNAVLPETDILYVTRIQKERFADPVEYEGVANSYVITPDTLSAAKPDLVLMHPLPRVGEISMAVDNDPRAAYFRQVEYGMYVRMALLALVLGKA
jgi:aspartate carbamoyltransferase catalytic subunit